MNLHAYKSSGLRNKPFWNCVCLCVHEHINSKTQEKAKKDEFRAMGFTKLIDSSQILAEFRQVGWVRLSFSEHVNTTIQKGIELVARISAYGIMTRCMYHNLEEI
ncbi:hypothetical protein AVEN_267547-1 [Araneus ventricosus]|uniref:Uncharacterized protein n=1 Tax=Araneus ventricosus TaxID=182803 RepID=A0A4Y2Q0L2_ARAVE|nr:hypothetical protein AVEN_267547-1 [Araneus ventricosus]